MLDTDTKRKIDDARNALVGKVPNPAAQVEQITTALIYKFMDDMDKKSQALGGKAGFFVKNYAKYSWSKLLDNKLSGEQRLELYQQAISEIPNNPHINPLFRSIFKGAFLPFRDARTLNIFLKSINDFTYDHSEKLGDAFEYLLSILGSQGDAGQFRTPRHIIDFIVEVVAPQKNDTILDPACGTAGFLISAYNYIIKTNAADYKRAAQPTNKKYISDGLTPQEKTTLVNNFTGYDISPDMVKLSLVNMFLHHFPNPKITEYDTLTDDKRWDENYNVILANPPFMSPKGGIIPHSRFSIQAKRSEVLFVDYIAEHLRIGGRAGIIVPEGIIFQAANAYKTLRKNLIENWGLYAVVSLPNGVFQPYSGVKTSVLLLDKKMATDKILFIKIENDGFDLGAQRNRIDKNDLPAACRILKAWQKNQKITSEKLAHAVSKNDIAKSGDYNLTSDRYIEEADYSNVKYPMVELGEVCQFIRGVTFSKKDYAKDTEDYILVATTKAAQSEGIRFNNLVKIKADVIKKTNVLLNYGDILISIANSANLLGRKTFIANLNKEYKYSFGAFMGLIRHNKKVIPLFLNYLLDTNQYKKFCLSRANTTTNISNLNWSDLSKFKIPLPPIEIQKEIATEIENYQKIIDGAKQVIENWKPSISINPEWEKVELGEVCEIASGNSAPQDKKLFINGKYPFYRTYDVGKIHLSDNLKDVRDWLNDEGIKGLKLFRKGTILFPKSGASTFLNHRVIMGFDGYVSSHLATITPNKKIANEKYIYVLLTKIDAKKLAPDQAYPSLKTSEIKKIKISLPPLEEQERIAAKIESEQKAIKECQNLINAYKQKINDKIAEVWGKHLT